MSDIRPNVKHATAPDQEWWECGRVWLQEDAYGLELQIGVAVVRFSRETCDCLLDILDARNDPREAIHDGWLIESVES